jgi:hypothetical protein
MLTFRAQSAMEYLMTYGWAILIIAVVLGALYSLGIFNGTNFLGNTCIAGTGYLCSNPSLATNGILSFTFGYYGPNITVSGFACSSNSISPNSFSQSGISDLVPGQQEAISVSCPVSANTIGTSFSGYLWMEYSQAGQSDLVAKVATISTAVNIASPPAAAFSQLVAGAITPSNPSGGGGTGSAYFLLTSNPSGGTTPYSFAWYTNTIGNPGCTAVNTISGAISQTYNTGLKTTGTYYYTYQVTDSNSPVDTACSPSDTATVASCFVGNTSITMANGTTLAIANISAGDTVLSYNTATNRTEQGTVMATMVYNVTNVYVLNGNTTTDAFEYFYVINQSSGSGSWVSAPDLITGSMILNPTDGALIRVNSVVDKGVPKGILVYDLRVSPINNYIANGYLADKP